MRGIPSYTVTEKSGHFCLICKIFLMFFQIWVYRYVTLCGRGGACPSRGRPHGAAPTSIIFYDTIRILCVGAAPRGRPRSDEGVAPYGKGKPPLNSNFISTLYYTPLPPFLSSPHHYFRLSSKNKYTFLLYLFIFYVDFFPIMQYNNTDILCASLRSLKFTYPP